MSKPMGTTHLMRAAALAFDDDSVGIDPYYQSVSIFFFTREYCGVLK